jgi:hypothetical protein
VTFALAVIQRNQGAVARAVAFAGHDQLRCRSPLLLLGRRLTRRRPHEKAEIGVLRGPCRGARLQRIR